MRDHLEIQGFDGELIAPALTAPYRNILGTSRTNTEYLEFFDKPEFRDLLVSTAKRVHEWLDEAKATAIKPPVKPAELTITRALSVRGNSGADAEAKIDAMLHDLALGDENNQNVCALLEFFDEDKAKQGKKLQVLPQVVRQTVAGIVLSKAQILRFTKKKKARGKKLATASAARQTGAPDSGVSAGA